MEWPIKAKNVFRIYTLTDTGLTGIQASLLLEATPAGRVEDSMRIALHSDRLLTATFPAEAILRLPEVEGYELTWQLPADTVKIRYNTVASQWEDLASLIAGDHVTVVKDGQNKRDDLLRAIKAAQQTDYTQGAVLRWAIHAVEGRSLQLDLQGLPASGGKIKSRAQFRLDSCPAVLQATYPLTADFNQEETVNGPRPILCSPDPEATTVALCRDPRTALSGMEQYPHNRASNTPPTLPPPGHHLANMPYGPLQYSHILAVFASGSYEHSESVQRYTYGSAYGPETVYKLYSAGRTGNWGGGLG